MENIPFLWAGTDPTMGLDCFGLASYVSDRLSGHPFDLTIPAIAEAYSKYPTPADAPADLLYRLAKKIGLARSHTLTPGTLLLIRSNRLCLATCLDDGNVVLMGSEVSEVRAIASFEGGNIWGAFEPDKLRKS